MYTFYEETPLIYFIPEIARKQQGVGGNECAITFVCRADNSAFRYPLLIIYLIFNILYEVYSLE